MKLLATLVKEFTLYLKDKTTIINFFILPIFVMVIANYAMKDMYGGDTKIIVPIVDLDNSISSRKIIEELSKIDLIEVELSPEDKKGEKFTEEQAGLLVKNKKRSGAIVIPSGFHQKLYSGGTTKLILLENPVEQIDVSILRNVVDLFTVQISANAISLKLTIDELTRNNISVVKDDEILKNLLAKSAILWKDRPVGAEKKSMIKIIGGKIDPLKQNIPGFAVMFALFSMGWVGMSLLYERDNGIYSRIFSAPVNKSTILAGKLILMFLATFAQLIVFFTFGNIAFDLNLGNSIGALLLMSMVISLATTSFGVFIASIVKTKEQVGGAVTVIVLGMSAIGGSWWPLEFMPESMQLLGHIFSINAWALDGYKDLLWYGGGVVEILPEVMVLTTFAAIVFTLGVWRFRFE